MINHVNGVKVIKVGLSALACLYDISMHLLIQRISYIKEYDLDNGVKVTNKH